MGCNSSSTNTTTSRLEQSPKSSSVDVPTKPQSMVVNGEAQPNNKRSSLSEQSSSHVSSTSVATAPFQGSTSASTTSTTKTLIQRQMESDRRQQQKSQTKEYNHYSSLPTGLPVPPRHKKYTPFQRPEYFFLEPLTQQISKENAMKEDAYSLQLSKLTWSLREAQREESLSRVSSMDPASPHSPPRVCPGGIQNAPKLDPFLGFAMPTSAAPLSSNEVPIIVPSPHRLSNRANQENNIENTSISNTTTYKPDQYHHHDGESHRATTKDIPAQLMASPSIPGQVV